MKEIIKEGPKILSSVEALTSRSQKPYSNGGDNLMSENNGQIEQSDLKHPVEAEAEKIPPTSSKKINQTNMEEAKKTTDSVKEMFKNKPLGEWTTEALEVEYKQALTADQDAEFKAQGFAEKEKIAADAQSRNLLLINELEARGVNVAELFLETTKTLGEKGNLVRSIGAASAGGGVVDRSGITNVSLLGVLDALDATAGLTKDAEDALGIAADRVSMMTEGKTPEEQAKFLKEKDILRERVRIKTKEVIEAKKARMDANYRPSGLYGERKLTENEKRAIRSAIKPEGEIEELFNRMFDRVDSRPQAEFSAAFGSIGSFEHDEFTKTLNEAITANKEIGGKTLREALAASKDLSELIPIKDENDVILEKTGKQRAEELTSILQQFENEYAARSMIHNAFYAVLAGYDVKKMSELIDSFQSGWADMAFRKEGVSSAMHYYEQALTIVKEKNGGYLRPRDVVGKMKINKEGEVNKLAKAYLEKANSEGKLSKSGKELKPWEIDRALSFARGMSILIGKTIEIAASSKLPEGATSFTDQYAQRIIQELAPFRHSYKFYTGSKFARILAYNMIRGRRPWETKEIKEWEGMKLGAQVNILNGLAEKDNEGKEVNRFFGVLNPFEIGGIFSRTGWRYAGSGISAIDDIIRSKIEKENEREYKLVSNSRREEIRREIGMNSLLSRDEIKNLFEERIKTEQGKLEDKIRTEANEDKHNRGKTQEQIEELVKEKIKEDETKVIEDESWIGTGVQMERKRGGLAKWASKKPDDKKDYEKAKEVTDTQLGLIADRTPLRLFLGIESVQSKVLDLIAADPENKTTQKKLREIMAKTEEEWEKEQEWEAEDRRVGEIVKEKILEPMDALVLLQEEAIRGQMTLDELFKSEDYIRLGKKMPENVDGFVKKISTVWGSGEEGERKEFLKVLEKSDWKVPYTFGTEDVPYDEYDFETTGLSSVVRRWRDMAAAAGAKEALDKLIIGIEHFRQPGQVVEAMRGVYEGIRNYNEDDARKFTGRLAEGIMKFYGKDYKARLPFGIGTLVGIITGKASAAQIAYGRGAIAWDEVELNEFTRLVRDNGMMTVDQQHDLQKRAGGGRLEASWGYSRTIVPLLAFAMAYYILSQVTEEKK